MSLKNLFGKKSLNVSDREKSTKDFDEVESLEYIEQYEKAKTRFIPEIDYEEPSNFARYGSAEKYYIEAIQDIYKTYPYDGSFYERQKWKNDRSDLINYIFEEVYPRTNGYINIGVDYGNTVAMSNGYYSSSIEEYIKFNATVSKNSDSSNLKDLFDKKNKYELAYDPKYSININGDDGATIEFYLKIQSFSGSPKQIIFDVWNGEDLGDSSYGRMKLEIRPGISGQQDKFYFELMSGSNGVLNAELGSELDFYGSWHHYAISYKNEDSSLKLRLFVDGDLVQEQTTGTAISQVYGAIRGHIGALITTATDSPSTDKGWGKLQGSLDEFRYWNIQRTDKQIARYYFTNVPGFSDLDDGNKDLGLYYKFNEGIYTAYSLFIYDEILQNENGEFILTSDGQQIIIGSVRDLEKITSYDKIILDYSGRLGNGTWIGYSGFSRSEGSAIVLSGNAKKEFKDPIIFPKHVSILALLQQYSEKGYEYDIRNNAALYNTLPSWKIDEDQQNGEQTKLLLQIISEFFDNINNQIKFLPFIKNINYLKDNPLPFSIKLLENSGFEVANIFEDSTVLENYFSRNETNLFEEDINNLRNYIYQNIYNNLLQIYKTKGTFNSFRNLLRCFGVDESLLKINMYGNDIELLLEDKYKNTTTKTKIINFNKPNSFEATIYQQQDPEIPSSTGYINHCHESKILGTTIEVQTIFPKKNLPNDSNFFSTDFVSCSLFGIHESEDGNWATNDRASVQVFAVRPKQESNDIKFVVSSSCFDINITSDLYKDVYDNSRWNIALRLRSQKYPLYNYIEGTQDSDFILELYAVSYDQDIKEEVCLISASVDSLKAEQFYQANKMLYVGAHRENYTGSVVTTYGTDSSIQKCDVGIVYARYWNCYLGDETVEQHAKDILNYGAHDKEYKTAFQQIILSNEAEYGNLYVPQNSRLSVYWNFENNRTINSSEFYTRDVSTTYNTDMTGKGYGFSSIDEYERLEYINNIQTELPEVLSSDDLVQILEQDDEYFTRDSKPINHYFAIEKSMYGVISREMISWLGTANNFNNLIGRPKYRYEEGYAEINKLRELFFRNVENEPDFEKFIDFYKWIEDSISLMFEQLIPASMNYSSGISNIIESHILERNKYRHKLPTVEFKADPNIPGIRTVNELLYSWNKNHAPQSGLERNNCSWWKFRAERTNIQNGNIDVDLNEQRVGIFNASVQTLNRNLSTVYNLNTQIEGTILQKKREAAIIINEAGFDLTGNQYFEVLSILPPNFDCED